MTTTPSTIHAAVERLWQERPECRPHFHDYPLSLDAVGDWEYGGGDFDQCFSCDDATAAERIEFGVDRLLEAEAKKLGTWCYSHQLPDGRWITWAEASGHGGAHVDRLAAKLKLAYSLCGIEPPEVLIK